MSRFSPAAADDAADREGELLQSHSVWDSSSSKRFPSNSTEATNSSIKAIKSPRSPGNSSGGSPEAFGIPAALRQQAEEDDFELIEPAEDFPQADGSFETITKTHAIHNLPRPRATSPRKYSKPNRGNRIARDEDVEQAIAGSTETIMEGAGGNDHDYHHHPNWHQSGKNADAVDLAGPGSLGRLECSVSKPQKEGEGTPNPYVSYLVIADTDFKSFQSDHSEVRRRFTDFVFLYKTLTKEYPQCAVPPLPDKHNMAYVRGDRFGPDFTQRRAHSLSRFLKRLTLHPVLRRATLLTLFLETSDWNATMKSRPTRGMSGSESATSTGVFESLTDSLLNAFNKPHKTDRRFQEVQDRAKKLDDDLGTVSKTVARVGKREGDLENDYADLAVQYQKLAALEPGVQDELTKFAASVSETSEGWKALREHTDQNYLESLNDMDAYISSVKALLKTREQKQLDFEGLTEYLNRNVQERDTLASHGSVGASGFLRQKIEDVRGVDHEQSRRERQRKLEVQISRLTDEVEGSKKVTEAFDEEVVKEVSDFERIKAVEFRDTLGGLADANIRFFQGNIEIWENFLGDMERQQAEAAQAAA